MKKMRWLVMVLVVGMLFSATLPVFADDSDETLVPPVETEVPDDGEVLTFTHPVIALLDEYFGAGDELVVPLPGEVVPPTTGEAIAAFHASGMGFGVLVKLYSIAEASSAACLGQLECTAVSVEELVAVFNSGYGMGNLMKDYGKPSMLGVGHVKQALNEDDVAVTGNEKSNNGKGKDKQK